MNSNRSSGLVVRLIIGLVIAGFSLFSFFASREYNPITDEEQYVSITRQQEIALGVESAPSLIQQFGGLYPDEEIQQRIDDIGFQLVNNSIARDTVWQFNFHVLDDEETINAFALPGGQVFITIALLSRFQSDDETAGVLAHEIVHVLARHGAQRIAKSDLTNGLIGAVGVASGEASAAQTAAVIGQLINLKYGRDDELQSDAIGVCLMIDAGYDPQGMVRVMEILGAASDGARQPEFFSTHPNPENRIQQIEEAIANADEECRFVD